MSSSVSGVLFVESETESKVKEYWGGGWGKEY